MHFPGTDGRGLASENDYLSDDAVIPSGIQTSATCMEPDTQQQDVSTELNTLDLYPSQVIHDQAM